MSSETVSTTSYFARCQEWLNTESNLSVEGLEQTIEKFSRQLRSEQASEPAVRDDLQDTLDLLSNHLVELLGPDGISSSGPSSGASEAGPIDTPAAGPAVDALLDLSPLQPLDGEVLELSATEKQRRIAEMLAGGAVTRGVSK